MKILMTGPFNPGSITEGRRKALIQLGHDVVILDQVPYFRKSVVGKIQTRLVWGPTVNRYERDLHLATSTAKPDLLLVDNAIYLSSTCVQQINRHCGMSVHYTSEYLGWHRYIFRRLSRAAPFYHAHVITNTLNVPIMRKWGAKNIIFTQFGFDPEVHHRVEAAPDEGSRFACDVAFGGHWEPFYEKMLRSLYDSGVELRVCGPNWHRARWLRGKMRLGRVSLVDYQKLLSSAKIGVTLLSKWNHNTSGGRTFEVPAFGTFLLAERTSEQLSYFTEGVEAEFFSNQEELVHKTQCYLKDAEKRAVIADAGHRRCLTSGYTYKDRMDLLLRDLRTAGDCMPAGWIH